MILSEEIALYEKAITDAECRIGSYIAMEGTEKSDQYVQEQIAKIKEYYYELEVRFNEYIKILAKL